MASIEGSRHGGPIVATWDLRALAVPLAVGAMLAGHASAQEPLFSPVWSSWTAASPEYDVGHATLAQHVALPDLPPVPPPLPPEPAGNALPGSPGRPDRGEASSPGSADIAGAERLGKEPEDHSLEFLRRETVLLAPGKWQLDVGLTYTITQSEFPVSIVGDHGIVIGSTRGRLQQSVLLVPLEVRYGLSRRLQLFFDAPVGYSHAMMSYAGWEDIADVGGIGDLRTGASLLMRRASGYSPEIIATFGATFPTGNSALPVFAATPDSQLGEGYYGASVNTLLIHTFDPVVVFYGAGYRHRFDATFGLLSVDPGEQISYQLGVGFSVNERITLSGGFRGMYVTADRLNSHLVEGGVQQPMTLRLAVSIVSGKRIIEPSAEIGMTDDAPRASVGVVYTF
jgi:hypothetical protein